MTYNIKAIEHIIFTSRQITEVKKASFSYSYSSEYSEFINSDILGSEEMDFNDWFNESFDPTNPDHQKYFTDFNGISNIGSKTIYFDVDSNRYDETTFVELQTIASMLTDVGLNISFGNASSNDYKITFIDQIGNIGSTVLDEATPSQSEWKSSYVILDFEYDNIFSNLLHETLHALGHGHDGKYNGDDYLTNNSQIVGDVHGVNLVSNTSYATEEVEKNILSANLELLWHNVGSIAPVNTDNSTYIIGKGTDVGKSTVENIVDFGGVDTIEVGTSYINSNGTPYLGKSFININNNGVISTQTISASGDSGYHYATIMKAVDVGQSSFAGTLIENVNSGESHDLIWTNQTDNVINSNGGDDLIYGSLGHDIINSGDGSDVIHGNKTDYFPAINYIYTDNPFIPSSQTPNNISKIYKEESSFFRQDTNTSLHVNAGDNNDAIYGTWHQDTLNGDGGNDLILGTHYEYKSGAAGSTIYEVPDGDSIDGGSGNDIIIAGFGNDTINGGNHSDFIYGSRGHDEMTGGIGSDKFYFLKEESNSTDHDVIKDFAFDNDGIELEYELIFTKEQLARYQNSHGTGEAEQQERIALFLELDDAGIIQEDAGNFVFTFSNESQLTLENSLLTGTDEEKVETFFNSVIINDEEVGNQSDGIVESLTDTLATIDESAKEIQGKNVLDYISEYMNENTGLIQEGAYFQNGINNGTQFADFLLFNEDGLWIEAGKGNDYIEATYTAEILSDTAWIAAGDGDDYIKGGYASEVLSGDSGNDLIHDGDGNDTVYGGSGNDTFYDGDGNDSLYGHAGDDFFYVGAGSNIYDGYHGTDTASFTLFETSMVMDFLQNSFSGEMADDTFDSIDIFEATHSNDTLIANNAGLHLKGAGGNDQIFGGTGADELHGDNGDDYIEGKGGADVLYGGAGNDTLDAKLNGDNTGATLYGGDGDDTIQGSTGSDMLYGGAGNDDIDGSTGSDEIYGGDDNDDIDAQGSNDLIYAGNGDDDINMGSGNDTAYGGAGNDVFTGYSGNNEFYGGAGTDTFNGGTDTDIVNFSLDEAAVLVDITQGSLDTDGTTVLEAFTSIEAVVGSTFDDDITGDTTSNTLSGHDGNDVLTGQSGQDVLNGDAGNDTLEGGNDDDLLYGGDGDDTLYGGSGTDELYGGAGNDELFGESGNDNMFGGSGNDILHGNVWVDYLFGGNDNDTLEGGSSNDELTGGLGADSFIFNQGDGHDTIFDFSAAQSDVLTLDQGAFTSGTTLSDIAASAYINGSGHLRIDIDTGGSITLEGVTSISVNELEWI